MSPITLALGIGFLALLALSATFSGSETALFSLDRHRLRRLEQSPSRRDRLVARVAARPDRLLGGILLGNTLANVASSSVMLALLTRIQAERGTGGDPLVASIVLTTLSVLLMGEIVPKGLAAHWPAGTSRFLVPILDPLLRVMAPAARLLEQVAFFLLRLVGIREEAGGKDVGRRELQLLFEDIREGEGITEHEGAIAFNILEFSETRAHEIMTPRVDLVGLPLGLPAGELRERVVAARHSRLPVFRDSLDQIIGFLNAKEFLLEPEAELETLLRPVHFVPERARLQRVLTEMQGKRVNLVVVVNEYGGTAGLLTLEDLVEEIVGEIYDEQEGEEVPELETAGPNRWRVAGLLSLSDLYGELGVEPEEGPADTVAGHVAHHLGRLPRLGDRVTVGPVTFQVTQVRRHRAERVDVTLAEGRGEPE